MLHETDLLYRIALTLVPNVGAVHARALIEQYGDARSIFKEKKRALEKVEGIGTIRANSLKAFTNFSRAEAEIAFITKYRIQPLFITDADYPKRFLHCYDPPTLLYYRGNTDLNSPKMVAIVGTRTNTSYGRQQTEQLIEELASQELVVISGLAFGIDAIAHRTALKYHLPTIGVVGHGLDTIYPGEHKTLAREMIDHGGLLTEFMSGTKPDKHHFPIRNRVVAGISDITIVVETSIKGGSLITAEMANNYNRDVFAFPGRAIDSRSSGCNYLIKANKAILLTDAQQLIEAMGWENKKRSPEIQRKLFAEFSDDEKVIIELLKEKEIITIDELNIQTPLSSSAVAAAVLNLELEGVIVALPGKRYRLG